MTRNENGIQVSGPYLYVLVSHMDMVYIIMHDYGIINMHNHLIYIGLWFTIAIPVLAEAIFLQLANNHYYYAYISCLSDTAWSDNSLYRLWHIFRWARSSNMSENIAILPSHGYLSADSWWEVFYMMPWLLWGLCKQVPYFTDVLNACMHTSHVFQILEWKQ